MRGSGWKPKLGVCARCGHKVMFSSATRRYCGSFKKKTGCAYIAHKERANYLRRLRWPSEKQKRMEMVRRWCKANPEKVRALQRKEYYRNKDKPHRVAHKKAYYLQTKERQLTAHKAWASANRDKVRAITRAWYSRNKAKFAVANKRWHAKNPGMMGFYARQRAIRKRNAPGQHTFEDWQKVKALFDYRCVWCGRQEPEVVLTEDHKIPLTKDGTNNIDNIQPMCLSCNSSKKTRVWFASRPVDKTWPNVKFSMFSLPLQPQPI
jgi:hypothetical protein